MFYRECGNLKDSYASDMAIFPIPLDRWGVGVMLILAFIVIPFAASDYWLSSIMIPFYCFSLAALGLNFLTGYAGQVSIGHAAFMAVGAYSSLILYSRYGIPLIPSVLGGGVVAAAVGAVFGIPSLRLKGFYLAVSTLAAQFIIEWVLTHWKWVSGGVFGTIDTPALRIFGFEINTATEKYFLVLCFLVPLVVMGKNLVRGHLGRSWMAIRDMDVAAEIIGISLFRDKVTAFAVSSFYAGVAGSLVTMTYYGAANIEEFNLILSFHLLGMIIIGGMGTVLGSFFGAGFMVLLPILINQTMLTFMQRVPSDLRANSEAIVFGALIVLFLIVEPYGMARLWQTVKDKLRLWPFPY
ncbi:MAG: branched-chain amino acid ABC transporter permease [Deltaproteobacteria bacterium]|nr:branched-chain amino acid ABC transporter permease [Deltaproteobacteria bacterium]MBW1949787.1 branched-chain amino acid ABC transporter permease [Deltaproteobacteria bacterium]MBW2103162.1 branched-chain amino acid ABC transporter permease [Deltaproteobacteria bacterium]MBW2348296.1 branched-chain amino acid ABC transporter permease [Deltaproteobacteria bacterium]RLB38169.1 MAG: branched-chain amino acid ABC transporter permease [Deltaproteobacteria bacterium]